VGILFTELNTQKMVREHNLQSFKSTTVIKNT
jgi:hypothetical protein